MAHGPAARSSWPCISRSRSPQADYGGLPVSQGRALPIPSGQTRRPQTPDAGLGLASRPPYGRNRRAEEQRRASLRGRADATPVIDTAAEFESLHTALEPIGPLRSHHLRPGLPRKNDPPRSGFRARGETRPSHDPPRLLLRPLASPRNDRPTVSLGSATTLIANDLGPVAQLAYSSTGSAATSSPQPKTSAPDRQHLWQVHRAAPRGLAQPALLTLRRRHLRRPGPSQHRQANFQTLS
jgi:hypothetical protein